MAWDPKEQTGKLKGGVVAKDTVEHATDGIGYHVRPPTATTKVRVLHGNSIIRDLNFHADGLGPPPSPLSFARWHRHRRHYRRVSRHRRRHLDEQLTARDPVGTTVGPTVFRHRSTGHDEGCHGGAGRGRGAAASFSRYIVNYVQANASFTSPSPTRQPRQPLATPTAAAAATRPADPDFPCRPTAGARSRQREDGKQGWR